MEMIGLGLHVVQMMVSDFRGDEIEEPTDDGVACDENRN